MAAEPLITSVPLPPGVREVLVFGGTFDPPHAAHARLPFSVRDSMLGPKAWLLYIPAARNPLKDHGPEASDNDRVRMLKMLIAEHLATSGEGRVGVWNDECERARVNPGPTYT